MPDQLFSTPHRSSIPHVVGADLLRAIDWSATPLGPLESWPRRLREMAEVILVQPVPMIILWGPRMVQVYNQGYAQICGDKHPAGLGQSNYDCWPEAMEQTRPFYERVISGESIFLEDQRFRLVRNGKAEDAYFTIGYSPLLGDTGKIEGVLAVLRETTSMMLAHGERERAAERLNLALAAAALGDWDWDPETDIIKLSARAAEMFGVSTDQPVLRSEMRHLLHPDDQLRAKAAAEVSQETGSDYEIEYRVVRPDGKQVWVATHGRGIYDAQGKLQRMLGVVQDVTRRKLAEQEREQLLDSERAARSDAERANHMKDHFLATLSHELRTPLNAIVGWSQILRNGANDPEELAEGLETIERNARVQSQIIEDLLDMSRIISGKIRLDIQRIDLADVVRAAIETVRPAATAKGIFLECSIDAHLAVVSGDPNRLQQVFWNLLSNAVKFTPRSGTVSVRMGRVASQLEIQVRDSGIGISPEFLPHVFDRFRQADASITRRHGGLGLGLSIVKQLVELHGGSASVNSEGEARGATFVIKLPIAPLKPLQSPKTAGAPAPKTSTAGAGAPGCERLPGIRVLVVDDEVDNRALVKRFLEDCDASIDVAASAAEAIARLSTHTYDVLISDIGMPDEDGYSLIRKVRQSSSTRVRSIPAIALTAFARSEDRISAIRAGFQSHVVKPVEPAELIAIVASLTGFKNDPAVS